MASKGNRVLKQKTLKAKRMDLEKGRSSKYVSRGTPEGDTTEKLPTKSDVRQAYKERTSIKKRTADKSGKGGIDFSKDLRDEYLAQIDEAKDSAVRKTKVPGAVTIRTGDDTRASKMTTKELKKNLKTVKYTTASGKEVKKKVPKSKKVGELLSRDNTKEALERPGIAHLGNVPPRATKEQEAKFGPAANDSRIQALASNKLTQRAADMGFSAQQTSGTRKAIEAELSKETKKAGARERRRRQSEEEAGIVASIKRDRDLKPGQKSTAQKMRERVAKKEKKKRVDDARTADLSYSANKEGIEASLKNLPKAPTPKQTGLVGAAKAEGYSVSTGGRPKEREVTIAPSEVNVRLGAGLQRRQSRKQKYNIMRAAGLPGTTAGKAKGKVKKNYQRAAAGAESVKLSQDINIREELKSIRADERATQVARNVDAARDKAKAKKLEEISKDTSLTAEQRAAAERSAHSIIRAPKTDVVSSGEAKHPKNVYKKINGKRTLVHKKGDPVVPKGTVMLTHRDTPMVERTIVDPRAIDKKYTRQVPLGAPRVFDTVEAMRGSGPNKKRVKVELGAQRPMDENSYESGRPVDKQGRTRSQRAADPTIAHAANKAPKLEVIEQKSPEIQSGLGMRYGHKEALFKVARHVWGEKAVSNPEKAEKLMGHVQAFAKQHANANRHLGNHESLVAKMVGAISKPSSDPKRAKQIEAMTGMIKAHGQSREEQTALATEKRNEFYAKQKELDKQSKT